MNNKFVSPDDPILIKTAKSIPFDKITSQETKNITAKNSFFILKMMLNFIGLRKMNFPNIETMRVGEHGLINVLERNGRRLKITCRIYFNYSNN